jgi:hypothetical protein
MQHLIVLAHGFGGSSVDLTYLASLLTKSAPQEILVLLSSRNEGRTRAGVATGGHRLVDEIRASFLLFSSSSFFSEIT